MKNAQEATGRVQIEKWYPTTTFNRAIEFKRFLKPFKAVFSGGVGGEFRGFEGGTENA